MDVNLVAAEMDLGSQDRLFCVIGEVECGRGFFAIHDVEI